MGSQYLISRRWSLTNRFTITDGSGAPRFEVQGKFGLGRKLSVFDTVGSEVAVISLEGLRLRCRIRAAGQETTVRPLGLFGKRFAIDSATGPMEAHGNFSGRQYFITRGGAPAASVSQLRTLREQFAVDVADGQDTVLMLAVVLAIEAIRDARRRRASS